MNGKQSRYAMWFHRFMIWFALWAFAVIAVIQGVRTIEFTLENGVPSPAVIVLLGALLILLGAFIVKVRFDLASFRAAVPVELPVACLAAAAIVFPIHLMLDPYGAFEGPGWIPEAVVFACWGIALYRYYKRFPDLFVN